MVARKRKSSASKRGSSKKAPAVVGIMCVAEEMPAIELGVEIGEAFFSFRITNEALKKVMDHKNFLEMLPPTVIAFFNRVLPHPSRKSTRRRQILFTQNPVEGIN